jgi:hypothetical protein
MSVIRIVWLSCACALIAFTATPPASADIPDDAGPILAQTAAATARVRSYTADLHADVQMKSFPYLAFHLTGTISYKRPNRYSVHFDHVPWFAKGFDDISMDELEPSTWPQKYEVVSLERSGDVTNLELRERKQPSVVTSVSASLDAGGLRTMRWNYNSGAKIEYSVTRADVDGVLLPMMEQAEIERPVYHILVHATLSDYRVVTDLPAPADGDERPAQ